MRASELRGLRWCDVNLKAGEITVRQRADRYNVIGKPKSVAAIRTVPMGPFVTNTLREWRLARPKGNLDLVFPTGRGNVECLQNIIHRGLMPAVIDAGLTVQGKPKYTGFHVLRHFYASWCINRKEDGGRGLPPKMVQRLMGHSTIAMTLDTYGHLFPETNDADELAAAERSANRVDATQTRHAGEKLSKNNLDRPNADRLVHGPDLRISAPHGAAIGEALHQSR